MYIRWPKRGARSGRSFAASVAFCPDIFREGVGFQEACGAWGGCGAVCCSLIFTGSPSVFPYISLFGGFKHHLFGP